MAAPAFGSVGTTYGNGPAMSHDIPVPASVAADDIIVVPILISGTATLNSLPSGFAHAPSSPVVHTTSHSLNVVWKRATGNDAGNYTFGTSAGTYVTGTAMRYTGAATSGTPFDTPGGGDTPTGTGSPLTTSPPVDITTLGVDRLLIWTATDGGGGAWTPPSAGGAWTERFGDGGYVASADKSQAAAGGTGSVSGSCDNEDDMSAWIGALKPAGVVEGPVTAWLTA